jgi:hypothetical protein
MLEVLQVSAAVQARLERRWPRIEEPKPEKLVADGRVWSKVQAAKPWRPREVGDALVGEFVSQSTRAGESGSYSVVTLKTAEGKLTVSGVVIQSLFDSAALPAGATVRVVYKGENTSAMGRTWKDFELFVATDEEPNPWP